MPSKAGRLAALSTPRGIIAALAMDQRRSLRKMIAAAAGQDLSAVSDAQLGNLAGTAAAWFTGLVVDRINAFPPAFIAAAAFALGGALLWGLVVGPVDQVRWRAEPYPT